MFGPSHHQGFLAYCILPACIFVFLIIHVHYDPPYLVFSDVFHAAFFYDFVKHYSCIDQGNLEGAIMSSGFLSLAFDQYFPPDSPEEKQLTGRLDPHARKIIFFNHYLC